jgi:hypothetical protein
MENLSNLAKGLITVAALALITLFVAITYRTAFLTYVDTYEFAYQFNGLTGELKALVNEDGTPKQGYIYSWPIVISVHTIDVRPMQVCINANSRVLNCKLVQFDPAGWKTFVAWHGRNDYSQSALNSILMSYSYDPSNKSYPFLKITKELKNQDVNQTVTNDTITHNQNNDTIGLAR